MLCVPTITLLAHIPLAFTPSFSPKINGTIPLYNTSTEISEQAVDNLSPQFQRLLIGLISYKCKYGNFNVSRNFVFGNDVDSRIIGYPLGKVLSNTIHELIVISEEPNKLDVVERHPQAIPIEELKDSYKYFRLVHFDISQVIKIKKSFELQIQKNLIDPTYGLKYPKHPKTNVLSSDPNMIYDEFLDSYHDKRVLEEARRVAKEGEKAILQYMLDEYRWRNYIPVQPLPEPSDRPEASDNIMRSVVDELLHAYQETDRYVEEFKVGVDTLQCFVPSSTRRDREGGYHHEFFHWSFEDFLGALVHFNKLYHTYNMEKYRESKTNGTEFIPLTFNKLERYYEVPSNDFWPEKWHRMPLGHFIHSIRDGDIDAKDHWLRRPILDRLRFDWGDGVRYLAFTWELFMKGIYWMLNVRGDSAISPGLVLPKDALVVRFGKPEEIQGLKIGDMFRVALQQSQVLFEHYPERYKFLEHSAFKYVPERGMVFGYRHEPHFRYNPELRGLRFSNTGKLFLADHTRPENFSKGVRSTHKPVEGAK